ncbi:hypothetical protein D3C87_1716420 [compost metagenome]
MNLPVHHHLNAALSTAIGQGNTAGVQQIGRTIGAGLFCRSHGTGQDQRFIAIPQVIKKHGGFFKGVGALGDNDATGALFHLIFRPGQDAEQCLEAQ